VGYAARDVPLRPLSVMRRCSRSGGTSNRAAPGCFATRRPSCNAGHETPESVNPLPASMLRSLYESLVRPLFVVLGCSPFQRRWDVGLNRELGGECSRYASG
jgi:hypothetical protein